PERNLFAQVDDVDVRVFESRPVIEHQQETGKRQNKEKEKGDSAHAPRVAHADSGFANFYRMQVKEDTPQHHEHPFAIRIRHADAEDGSVDLTFLDVLSHIRWR